MNNLTTFIRSHGIRCRMTDNGTIQAIAVSAIGGKARRELAIIPANICSVRKWLGY